MDCHFLAYMYRLKYIDRWSLMRNNQRENVAEHTFHVALLAHTLCIIAKNVFHKEVPLEAVISAALFHDATEVITGDIPTPVKHHNGDILKSFREIERLASERLLHMIPSELQDAYKPLLMGQDEEICRWVKAADRLDSYLKCTFEVLRGNREFVIARDDCLHALRTMDMPEIDYFLETFAPSFEKTLDEIQ
ncbi:MAG: 5'-deoxynucleotidase [Alicyclobacillus sp.]|nr:5'-deoxynucleotidase [Alicyclobacillus sp.]